MNIYARRTNDGRLQSIEAHREGVIKKFESFLSSNNFSSMRFMFCVHDHGKYSDKFASRLYGSKNNFRHSEVGALILWKTNLKLEALVEYSHHTRLVDFENFNDKMQNLEKSINLFDYPNYDKNNIPKSVIDVNPLVEALKTRFKFSYLVDADRLDAEEFFDENLSRSRYMKCDFNCLNEKLLIYINKKSKDGKVNVSRNEIKRTCIEKSNLPPDIYRLSVPTGLGKTLSSMAFAIPHLIKNGLARIIYIAPFLSIIDQISKIFKDKDLFGEEYILEYHSSVDYDNNNTMRLASENWDAPIIITTPIQFFESLFSNKSSECRKLHNILGSLIIVDEIQFLPSKYLLPICDVLSQLVKKYGCSILLSTATQPGYQFFGFGKGKDLIEKDYSNLSQRVEYKSIGKMNINSLADRVKNEHQCLIGLNTKKDARELAMKLNCFHLSANMCMVHRREVLKEVSDRLSTGKKCILVTTQVIEAGVDLDFPIGYRVLGPLVGILQFGGRVNREGRLKKSVVNIFEYESISNDFIFYSEYGLACQITKRLLENNGNNIMNIDCESYYKIYLDNVKEKNELGQGILEDLKELKFKTVAENFKMIENGTISIVVNYKCLATDFINSLRGKILRENLRKLQPFMISVTNNLFNEIKPNLKEIGSSGIFELCAKYYDKYGIRRK